MKKLLALLLLSPLVSGEDYGYEYPIDLTCEWGSVIAYFHITKNPDNSWSKIENDTSFLRMIKKEEKKTHKLRKLKETKNAIMWITMGDEWHLNRHTLKMTIRVGSSISTANCYKGFKEYNEKQI